MASINFNAEQVEPTSAYDVLPKGKYLCVAVSSELKETKNRTGEYLQITFEVIGDQFKGRKIFERLNIRNQNKTAEEIGQRALSALCHAVGVLNIADSEQLHNIPVYLDITIEDGRDGYDAQNRVKGYSSASESSAAPAPRTPMPRASAAATHAAAATAAASTPVWKRKAA